jgi:hypothetical protein
MVVSEANHAPSHRALAGSVSILATPFATAFTATSTFATGPATVTGAIATIEAVAAPAVITIVLSRALRMLRVDGIDMSAAAMEVALLELQISPQIID